MIGYKQAIVQPLVRTLLLLCGLFGVAYASSNVQPSEDNTTLESEVSIDEINRILALSDDVDYGEYLAGECASCHSHVAVEGSSVPVIHGAEPTHLVRALLEFRSGARSGTTMGLVANGLDDEEISAIVYYLASVAPAGN